MHPASWGRRPASRPKAPAGGEPSGRPRYVSVELFRPAGRQQKIRLVAPPDPPAHYERPKTLITRLHWGKRDPLALPGREYNQNQPPKRRLGRYFHTAPAGPPDARRDPPAQEPAGPAGDL